MALVERGARDRSGSPAIRSARAIRLSAGGWLPNQNCDQAGGVGSASERSASLRCRPTNAAASSVACSASTSALVSICRLIPFCTGAVTSVASATSASTTGTTAGSAAPRQPPTGQRSQRQGQRTHPEHRAGRPENAIR